MRAAELYREAGIEVAAFFIVGYPGETVASIEETFALALALPLDEISFNVPMPLPGSKLFERLGAPDEGRDWTRENEVTFVFPSDIDESWLRRRIDETMAAFAARRRPGRREARPRSGRRYFSSRNSLSVGLSKSLRAAGAKRPQPPLHLELRVALEQGEAHLQRREVALVGEHVVHEQGLLRTPWARDPVADPLEQGGAGERVGHRETERSPAAARWRSAACRARCRRSRRGSRG